jgi:hypothetical protein
MARRSAHNHICKGAGEISVARLDLQCVVLSLSFECTRKSIHSIFRVSAEALSITSLQRVAAKLATNRCQYPAARPPRFRFGADDGARAFGANDHAAAGAARPPGENQIPPHSDKFIPRA